MKAGFYPKLAFLGIHTHLRGDDYNVLYNRIFAVL